MRPDRPSSTARLIARSIILSARHPALRRLVAPGESECLSAVLRACEQRTWLDVAMQRPWCARWLWRVERAVLPGISAHYLARKRWLDRVVTAQLRGGVAQVVVLGAGFDTLAWRHHRDWPRVSFFELDHPATQRPKRRALARGQPNLAFLPADLAHELPSAVLKRAAAFDPSQPTLFLAEGLLMYFSPERVATLLRDLASYPYGSLALSCMEPGHDGRAAFRGGQKWVDAWLRVAREPFAWALPRARLAPFLAGLGWQLKTIAGATELRASVLAPARLGHAALAEGEYLGTASRERPLASGLVNDVHSQLNATHVSRILTPSGLPELATMVRRAGREGAQLSICGGRHAMGGQQFGTGNWLLDVRQHASIRSFDRERGLITADAGIQWPELIAGYLERQPATDGGPQWGIRQKQTGADRLTLGGALAANIHGRGLRLPPFVGDVEAFTLIDAHGEVRRCSRSENSTLFRLAIGGYGLFGLVADVTLRLARRVKVERHVDVLTLDELIAKSAGRDTRDWLFGDFQYAIDERSPDFLQRGVCSIYRRLPDDAAMPATQSRLQESDWARLLHLAHVDRARAFAEYARYYVSTSGQRYWSDTHQMSSYTDNYHEDIDRKLGARHRGSEMITELYVPRAALRTFMAQAAEKLRRGAVPVIYGTIRLIERDTESFLAWAREPWACVVFNLHVDHTPAGIAKAAAAFRGLIDLSLGLGGSYYLTYHRWATRAQAEAAHPRLREFLELKRAYDPTELFTSDWYRHHRAMFEVSPSKGLNQPVAALSV